MVTVNQHPGKILASFERSQVWLDIGHAVLESPRYRQCNDVADSLTLGQNILELVVLPLALTFENESDRLGKKEGMIEAGTPRTRAGRSAPRIQSMCNTRHVSS